ncbi:hypothetical protein ACWCWQ_00715 [Streptomyces sp. NPDC001571]
MRMFRRRSGRSSSRSRSRTARIAGERRMLVAMAVDATGSGMYVPFSLVFFHHVTGLGFATVGLVLTAVGLVGLGALPLAGAAVDRYGAQRVQLFLTGCAARASCSTRSPTPCPPSRPSHSPPPSATGPSRPFSSR